MRSLEWTGHLSNQKDGLNIKAWVKSAVSLRSSFNAALNFTSHACQAGNESWIGARLYAGDKEGDSKQQ